MALGWLIFLFLDLLPAWELEYVVRYVVAGVEEKVAVDVLGWLLKYGAAGWGWENVNPVLASGVANEVDSNGTEWVTELTEDIWAVDTTDGVVDNCESTVMHDGMELVVTAVVGTKETGTTVETAADIVVQVFGVIGPRWSPEFCLGLLLKGS